MVRVVKATPGRFTPGNNPVPTVCEARWGPGPVWRGAENLTSYRNWTSRLATRHGLNARGESLYRLSYPGTHLVIRMARRLTQNRILQFYERIFFLAVVNPTSLMYTGERKQNCIVMVTQNWAVRTHLLFSEPVKLFTDSMKF